MPGLFSFDYERWRSHPKRHDLLFLLGTPVRRHLAWRQAEAQRRKLLVPPIDTSFIEILTDEEFRASAAAARGRTMLDVARLANLWYLARQAGPGVYLEVGSFRGGGALHVCNAVQTRKPRFYSFDPFEAGGFEAVGSQDKLFRKDQFTDTSYQEVVRLLSGHPNATVVKGYFPAAAENLDLRPIAFCHLDVDVYEATPGQSGVSGAAAGPKSFIVMDDVHRNAKGCGSSGPGIFGGQPFVPVDSSFSFARIAAVHQAVVAL